MIYCIIATDKETGNEWVMPKTAETIVEIGAILDNYRDNDPRFEYRLDLVSPGAAENLATDLQVYYRNKIEERRRKFTAQELFPPRNNIPTSDCEECGAYVRLPQHVKHAEWHNKVADL